MRYSTSKYTVTLSPELGVTQGHRNRHGSIRRLCLPIDVPYQHGPISYRFRDKWWFQFKIANSSRILCPHRRGFPWNLVPALGVKKTEWWGYRAEKEDWHIFSRLNTTHERDRRTDRERETPEDSKDIDTLLRGVRIASRDNISASSSSVAYRPVKQLEPIFVMFGIQYAEESLSF